MLLGSGRREQQLADQRQRIADPELLEALERGLAEGGYDAAQRRVADVLAARYEASGPAGNLTAMAIAKRWVDGRDLERALHWLERSYEEHDPNLPYVSLPVWDPLRADPRFQSLLRRMNLPAP